MAVVSWGLLWCEGDCTLLVIRINGITIACMSPPLKYLGVTIHVDFTLSEPTSSTYGIR